jgi:glycosyltransferase involved in cell wall biosynthesis
MKRNYNHTFVICAYKESKYLEECIISLINQSIKSNIIIATSTPNKCIEELAQKYNLKIYINHGQSGIGNDWNFAVSKCNTEYVTIAHQDDIYEENYLENILYTKKKKEKKFVIAFSDYGEIRQNRKITQNFNLNIKKIMLFPLRFFKKSKVIQRLVLSFGNPICCPSVTLNKKLVGDTPYLTDLKCSLDWDTWASLAKIKGKFEYVSKNLMFHRIHEESETSNLIENNVRLDEDYIMFQKFWPKWFAKILISKYSRSMKSNEIKVIK